MSAKTIAQNKMNLYQRINAIVAAVGPLSKQKENKHFDYKYTGHDQIMAALAPLQEKFGVVILPPEPIEHQRIEIGKNTAGKPVFMTQVKYQFEILNADKPEERFTRHVWSEALDSQDKGFNKCSTQADKYLCFRLFRIATPADDPDALHTKDSETDEEFDRRTEGQRRIAQFQVNAFFEACANNGKTAEQMAAYLKEKFGLVQVEELMRSQFNDAIKWATQKEDMQDTIAMSIRAANAKKKANGQATPEKPAETQATGD